MNKTLIEIVVDALLAAGLHCERAFPAGRMPAIDCLETTVGLKEMDREANTATVKVSVLSPAKLGAPSCEDAGLHICRLLRQIGGKCCQGEVAYDARGDFFYVPVEATFAGYEALDGWSEVTPAPVFTVKAENTVLEYAVSFDAEYSLVAIDKDNSAWRWAFRLEEITPFSRQENDMPEEPFRIAVAKEFSTEVYSDCVITNRKRLFREDGLHQIWEGTATGMTMTI